MCAMNGCHGFTRTRFNFSSELEEHPRWAHRAPPPMERDRSPVAAREWRGAERIILCLPVERSAAGEGLAEVRCRESLVR